MPPLFFEENIKTLRQIFPLLVKELDKADDSAQVEASASGDPTLVVDSIYIHSRHDPKKEAERLVGIAAGNDESPALVLGFGLGYSALALAEKFPKRPIIVVEKRPEIIKKALESSDLRPLLRREGLVFVLDADGLQGALSLFESSPGVLPLVLRNRALMSLDTEWYARVEEKIIVWNTRTNVNRATQKRFGKRWIRNLSKNLEAVRDRPGIASLKGLLAKREIPVFLLAAGPSLDRISPYLDEISKRCLLVAVDTSLRFLATKDKNPDFVLSVDPQYWNSRHLDYCQPSASLQPVLIAESAVYPALLRLPFKRIFLCGSFFPLGRFIEERVDSKGELGTGGSVATSAWDFARLLGAEEVWISGLDLSYPDLKTHFHGALFEEKCLASSGRFSPAETWNFRLIEDGQPFKVKKNSGGEPGGFLLTDKRLSLYASWFESSFFKYDKIRNYGFLSSGLEIKGLLNESGSGRDFLEDFLSLPERRKEIDSLLETAFKTIENDFFKDETRKTREEKFKNARESLGIGLKEIENLALSASEQAGTALAKAKLGHLSGEEGENVLKKLGSANDAIVNSQVKEIASFLLSETESWEAEIAGITQNSLERHLAFSLRFYRALALAAAENLKILQR